MTKISYFTSTKDKIPELSQNNFIYQITCPSYDHKYICKTERCLDERFSEDSSDFLNLAVVNHFTNCEHAQYLVNLNKLYDNVNSLSSCNTSANFKNLVVNNFKILYRSNSVASNKLLLLEALYIRGRGGGGLGGFSPPLFRKEIFQYRFEKRLNHGF